jgi:hypothetical protein
MSTTTEWESFAVKGAATTLEQMEPIVRRYSRENDWFAEYDSTENADKIFGEFKRTKLPFSALTFDEVVRSLIERGELRKIGDVPVEDNRIAILKTNGQTVSEESFSTGATTLSVGSIDRELTGEATPELAAWVRDVYLKTSARDCRRLVHQDPDFKSKFEASAAAGII